MDICAVDDGDDEDIDTCVADDGVECVIDCNEVADVVESVIVDECDDGPCVIDEDAEGVVAEGEDIIVEEVGDDDEGHSSFSPTLSKH
eukprot:7361068-Pyramimonas_sp.AAC.1